MQERFDQVSWSSLDANTRSKSDMFQVWLAKQCIGIGATRSNMAQIQGLLDDNCPNCRHPKETNDHLNHCPDPGRTLLLRDGVAKISRWMYKQSRTDAKLAYWVGKYLIFWGTHSSSSLVRTGSGGWSQLLSAAASQDLIGWTEFLHGNVSVEFESIQHFTSPFILVASQLPTG